MAIMIQWWAQIFEYLNIQIKLPTNILFIFVFVALSQFEYIQICINEFFGIWIYLYICLFNSWASKYFWIFCWTHFMCNFTIRWPLLNNLDNVQCTLQGIEKILNFKEREKVIKLKENNLYKFSICLAKFSCRINFLGWQSFLTVLEFISTILVDILVLINFIGTLCKNTCLQSAVSSFYLQLAEILYNTLIN